MEVGVLVNNVGMSHLHYRLTLVGLRTRRWRRWRWACW